MRKLLVSVAIATATLAAVPAAAQLHTNDQWAQRDDRRGDNRGGWNRRGPSRQAINELLRDLSRAENQIARAQQRRMISRREAASLRREASQIRFQLNRAARNGISGREFGELRVRVNRLEQRVRSERRDRDRRPG